MSAEMGSERQETVLEQLAREAGDANLFPDDVVRLWNDGQGRKARKALVQAARTERNPERALLQKKHAANFRLWLEPLRGTPSMFTFNGFGTMLYGKHQKEADSSFIATLWIVLLFVPIWPLASYLVTKAQPRGWHFLAKAPRPPFAQVMQRLVVVALVALVVLTGVLLYDASTHSDVLVYNGFDQRMKVRIGDQETPLMGHGHAWIRKLPAKPTNITARLVGQDEVFETLEVDLTHHTSDLVIYNIGGRGALGVHYVLYGEGEPKDGHWLDAGPLLFVRETIDYPFLEPPESKTITEGGTVQNSVLEAVGPDASPVVLMMDLIAAGRSEQAHQLGMAELKVHPENAEVAWATAHTNVDDVEARKALFRDCIARAPEEVDLHRYYQEVWPQDDRQPLLEEYQARLAEAPDSAMNQYLVGRLVGDEAALPYFQEALRLDPEFEAVYQALGYRSVMQGDYRDALGYYDRYAAFGPAQAGEIFQERLRLHRALASPAPVLQGLLAEVAESSERNFNALVLQQHLQLEANPGGLEAAIHEVELRAKLWWGNKPGSAELASTRAHLALTAGDFDRVRSELRTMARAQDSSYHAVELRLALSDGASTDDRERLESTGEEWIDNLDETWVLLGLELVDPAHRPQYIERLGNPDLAELGRLLEDADAVRDSRRISAAVSRLVLSDRAVTYLAAARRLIGRSDSASVQARKLYLRRAWEHSLPGELPFGTA